jgi:transketolase
MGQEITNIPKGVGLANLEVFASTLESLAQADKTVFAVTSDSRGSGKLVAFGQNFQSKL